jgi:hypothetical protein
LETDGDTFGQSTDMLALIKARGATDGAEFAVLKKPIEISSG